MKSYLITEKVVIVSQNYIESIMRFNEIKKEKDFILFILLLLLYKIFVRNFTLCDVMYNRCVIRKSIGLKPRLNLLAAKIIQKWL